MHRRSQFICILGLFGFVAGSSYPPHKSNPWKQDFKQEVGGYGSSPGYGSQGIPNFAPVVPRYPSYGQSRQQQANSGFVYKPTYNDNPFGGYGGGHGGGYGGGFQHGSSSMLGGFGGNGGGYGGSGKRISFGNAYPPKQKDEFFSVISGISISGGKAIYGRFKSLEQCQEACVKLATCMAADYQPWTYKCFVHTNVTACESLKVDAESIHFKRIPCNTFEVGANGLVQGGITITEEGEIQSGIHDLKWCIKKCLKAEPGQHAVHRVADSKSCYALRYDFYNRECVHYPNQITDDADPPNVLFEFCPADAEPTTLEGDIFEDSDTSVVISLCPADYTH